MDPDIWSVIHDPNGSGNESTYKKSLIQSESDKINKYGYKFRLIGSEPDPSTSIYALAAR